jgi:orotate phosphoribosyltransferase
LQADEVLQRFKKTGALLEGHFVLSSGLHSAAYLQCALVLQHPEDAEEFGRSIADQFQAPRISTVATPSIGGNEIGH